MSGSTRSWARCPVLSQRAAFHLRDIARLLPVMNALIDAMEADCASPSSVPAAPALDIAGLREQARRLVDDLRGADPVAAGREAGTARPRRLDRRPGRSDRPRPGLRPDARDGTVRPRTPSSRSGW